MGLECTARIFLRVADGVWNRLTGSIQLRLRNAIRVANSRVGRLPVYHRSSGGELVVVGSAGLRIKLTRVTPGRVIHAVTECGDRKDRQCADLNDIDRDVHGG